MSFKKIVLLFALCVFSCGAFAADANDPHWQFSIAPYFWAINMDGRVAAGSVTKHIDADFSEIWQHFDGGIMLWADAHKGPYGVFINGLYAVLSDTDHKYAINANAKVYFGIYDAALSYIALQKSYPNNTMLQLEPYLGARYTMNHARVNANTSPPRPPSSASAKNNQNWTDPIVGLILHYHFNNRWFLQLLGDVGGTSTSSDCSYNVLGLIGYKPTKASSLYLGYNDLYQKYQTGSGSSYFNWDMRLFGPVAGFDIQF